MQDFGKATPSPLLIFSSGHSSSIFLVFEPRFRKNKFRFFVSQLGRGRRAAHKWPDYSERSIHRGRNRLWTPPSPWPTVVNPPPPTATPSPYDYCCCTPQVTQVSADPGTIFEVVEQEGDWLRVLMGEAPSAWMSSSAQGMPLLAPARRHEFVMDPAVRACRLF